MPLEDSAWAPKKRLKNNNYLPYNNIQHSDNATTPAAAEPSTQHKHHPNIVAHDIRAEHLQKVHRLTRRLRWKAAGLLCAYDRVNTTTTTGRNTHHHTSCRAAAHDPPQRAAARAMFKLDFFEFYTLLERALVLCLALAGVRVSRTAVESSTSATAPVTAVANGVYGNTAGNGIRDAPPPIFQTSGRVPAGLLVGGRTDTSVAVGVDGGVAVGGTRADASTGTRRTHRFHANVLEALERAGDNNALCGALGRGEVRGYLGRAKELRNRWKDVEFDMDDEEAGSEDLEVEEPELREMLEGILGGLEGAEDVLRGSDQGVEGEMEVDWVAVGEEVVSWEILGDAMEWEAVGGF